jgi:hypothetical protein
VPKLPRTPSPKTVRRRYDRQVKAYVATIPSGRAERTLEAAREHFRKAHPRSGLKPASLRRRLHRLYDDTARLQPERRKALGLSPCCSKRSPQGAALLPTEPATVPDVLLSVAQLPRRPQRPECYCALRRRRCVAPVRECLLNPPPAELVQLD